MTPKDQQKIAASFPNAHQRGRIDLEISIEEFKTFEVGFADSIEDKWKIFVLEDVIYFARSWTNYCIYKVLVEKKAASVWLTDFQVNRDKSQYTNKDIEYDLVLLKKLFQLLLNREDFYSDPKLELPLIKKAIEILDPSNQCKKAIRSNTVALIRDVYNGLTTDENKKHHDVIGWTELKKKIADRDGKEVLISLYLHNRETNSATTCYFDCGASELLGRITIIRKSSS